MSTVLDSAAARRHSRSSTSWLWGVGLSLLVLGLSLPILGASIGSALWKAARSGGDNTAAVRLQVNSQKLANLGREAVNGETTAFDAFRETKGQIEEDVRQINYRFGSAPDVAGVINSVNVTWTPMGKNADQIISSQKAVVAFAGNVKQFNDRIPQLQQKLDEVVRAMTSSGAQSQQIYYVLRQVVLSASMARRIAEIRAGGPGAMLAGEALSRDATVFAQVLKGLREGDQGMNIQRLTNPTALAALNQANAQWTEMQKDLTAILSSSQDLFRAQAAAGQLTADSAKLLADSETLFRAFTAFGPAPDTGVFGDIWISVFSSLLTLLSVVFLVVSIYRAQRQRYERSTDRHAAA